MINGRLTELTVPIEDFPYVVLLSGDQPGLLTGNLGTEKIIATRVHVKTFDSFCTRNLPTVPTLWRGGAWERWMAKIAHGYAYSEGALNGYDALLPAVILAETPLIDDHVGASDVTPAQMDELFAGVNSYNRILLDTKSVGEIEYLIAHVQVFAPLKWPVYQAVIGRRPEKLPNIVSGLAV
jgi:hypothetical protein